MLGGEIKVGKHFCDGGFKRVNIAFGLAVKMWSSQRHIVLLGEKSGG